MISNYNGPGMYQHYKGGYYRVFGLAQHEATGARGVIYSSYNIHHDKARFEDGVDFVFRPLNPEDGEDCWNSFAANDVPRFVKVV